MEENRIPLQEVDEVRITILMDNTIDLLMASSEVAQRFDLTSARTYPAIYPIAEHGFSALITVRRREKEEKVLLDAGISPDGVLHNMKVLRVNLADIRAIVLSHGHSDHTMGLPGLINQMHGQEISLVLHPDACLKRKIALPNGFEWDISGPGIEELRRDNVKIIEKSEPTLLAGNMILVSGEIERITDFEKGFPVHYTKRYDVWEPDPLIKDDQCLVMNVRGQGLVVVTGCGHSGIINTVRYAQTLTGQSNVLAVLGGFHLTGGLFEKIIPPTIAEMKKINPRYIMPGHCTGWSAIHQFARAMPDAFIPNNVGTTLIFKN